MDQDVVGGINCPMTWSSGPNHKQIMAFGLLQS